MHEPARFDAALLRRHDRPGPRYTSYPSAPRFSSDFRLADLGDHARLSNASPVKRPLSLYLHIPSSAARLEPTIASVPQRT